MTREYCWAGHTGAGEVLCKSRWVPCSVWVTEVTDPRGEGLKLWWQLLGLCGNASPHQPAPNAGRIYILHFGLGLRLLTLDPRCLRYAVISWEPLLPAELTYTSRTGSQTSSGFCFCSHQQMHWPTTAKSGLENCSPLRRQLNPSCAALTLKHISI